MRYVVDSNNYVTAISFGTEIVYNDCVCVEYTGMVPSSWDTLEAWYFDEGDKLWRWQIIDGELVMDESATAPEEGTWMGSAMSDPIYAQGNGTKITFDLPDGTDKLVGFFILFNGGFTKPLPASNYCSAIYASLIDNKMDAVLASASNSSSTFKLQTTSCDGGFTIENDTLTIDFYEAFNTLYYFVSNEYALYPFYRR